MNDLISIIIPIYKVEAYLRDCLNSVQKQTYTNFEVLLINDGSPDNSEQICLEFEQKDTRFNYFYKENGGVSSARNLGIEKATGKWIVFIDSDDTVEENYLKDFIDNYVDDTTLLIQDLTKETNGQVKVNRLSFIENKYYNLISDFEEIIKNPHILEGFIYNKFFKRSFILDNNICFKTNITHKEDEIFCLEYYNTIENIQLLTASNYHYINRGNSVTSNHPSFNSEFEYFKNYIFQLNRLGKSLNSTVFNKYLSEQLSVRLKYLMYGINRNISKKERIFNFKKIKNEFGIYSDLITKTTIQNIDFLLLNKGFYRLVDTLIILRKW